jgi:hypothetical protein
MLYRNGAGKSSLGVVCIEVSIGVRSWILAFYKEGKYTHFLSASCRLRKAGRRSAPPWPTRYGKPRAKEAQGNETLKFKT